MSIASTCSFSPSSSSFLEFVSVLSFLPDTFVTGPSTAVETTISSGLIGESVSAAVVGPPLGETGGCVLGPSVDVILAAADGKAVRDSLGELLGDAVGSSLGTIVGCVLGPSVVVILGSQSPQVIRHFSNTLVDLLIFFMHLSSVFSATQPQSISWLPRKRKSNLSIQLSSSLS